MLPKRMLPISFAPVNLIPLLFKACSTSAMEKIIALSMHPLLNPASRPTLKRNARAVMPFYSSRSLAYSAPHS
jgi:hypothetical protein